jgi:choline/glycine/proline betaine transport protein
MQIVIIGVDHGLRAAVRAVGRRQGHEVAVELQPDPRRGAARVHPLAGHTEYLLREWVQSIGAYLQNFVGLSFTVSAFQGEAGEQWQAAWTSFYWGWWISWAPFVGIFIARVSKGRTVREFVLGVLVVPTLVGILWFAVLGGSALYQELTVPGSMLAADGTVDLQGALFQLFAHLPAGPVLTVGAILLIGIFFVTSADSGALVMGMLATGGDVEPKRWVRVFFTLATAVLAVALLLAGGCRRCRRRRSRSRCRSAS